MVIPNKGIANKRDLCQNDVLKLLFYIGWGGGVRGGGILPFSSQMAHPGSASGMHLDLRAVCTCYMPLGGNAKLC